MQVSPAAAGAGARAASGAPAPEAAAAPAPREVHLFPGQGDFALSPLLRASGPGGPLREAALAVFRQVDEVTALHGLPPLAPWLFGPAPPGGRDLARAPAGTVQLALFGASMTVHQALCARFRAPDALVGVSFGEIAALTAAGAYTIAEGAAIAYDLGRVLTASCPGGLTLLGCGEARTRALLAGPQTAGLVPACVNDDRETVVSGPVEELGTVEKRAADEGVPAVRLRLPFSSHHPALARQAEEFARAAARHRARPTTRPVLSAVARRPYASGDDLARRLADCLILPAHVPDVLLLAAGHSRPGQDVRLLEAGTGGALTRNARRVLAGRPGITAAAPLADPAFPW